MKSDQVEKKIINIDGDDLEGLIAMDEYVVETDVVDIPGRDSTVPVSNGVLKIPSIGLTFKISRNSETLKILEDWFKNKETKNVTVIVTDGAGNEIRRELMPNTQCSKCNGPGYAAESPVAAQIMTTFLPENIVPIRV